MCWPMKSDFFKNMRPALGKSCRRHGVSTGGLHHYSQPWLLSMQAGLGSAAGRTYAWPRRCPAPSEDLQLPWLLSACATTRGKGCQKAAEGYQRATFTFSEWEHSQTASELTGVGLAALLSMRDILWFALWPPRSWDVS